MKELRCPKCNDIITEEDIVAYDGESLITFRHCGRYWNVKISDLEGTDASIVWTYDLGTSQEWLYNNKPLYRITTPAEDSDKTV